MKKHLLLIIAAIMSLSSFSQVLNTIDELATGLQVRTAINGVVTEHNRQYNATGFSFNNGGASLSTFLTTIPLANGGLGVVLSDPDADRLIYWNDTNNQIEFIAPGQLIGNPLVMGSNSAEFEIREYDASAEPNATITGFQSLDGLQIVSDGGTTRQKFVFSEGGVAGINMFGMYVSADNGATYQEAFSFGYQTPTNATGISNFRSKIRLIDNGYSGSFDSDGFLTIYNDNTSFASGIVFRNSTLSSGRIYLNSDNTFVIGRGGSTGISINSSSQTSINGLQYPIADGTTGQVIQTDGSGVLSFVDAGGGLGAGNGLTENTGNVDLGGTVSANIDLATDTNGSHTFNIGTSTNAFQTVNINSKLEVGDNNPLSALLSVNPGGITGTFNGDPTNNYLASSLELTGVTSRLRWRNTDPAQNILSDISASNVRAIVQHQDISNSQNVQLSVGSSAGQFLLTDDRTTATGIQYAADYSANFTDRSLVDKAYVDSQGGGGGPTFGTDNQIPFVNAAGNDFDYTSNLTYDGTTFTSANSNFQIGNTTDATNTVRNFTIDLRPPTGSGTEGGSFSVLGFDRDDNDNADFTVGSKIVTGNVNNAGNQAGNFLIDRTQAYIRYGNNINQRGISFTNSAITVTDLGGLAGMSYAADYSAANTSNPRWIPDKAYVDGLASAPGIDDVLAQAQALTANRTINAGSNSFNLNKTTTAGQANLRIDNTGASFEGAVTATNLVPQIGLTSAGSTFMQVTNDNTFTTSALTFIDGGTMAIAAGATPIFLAGPSGVTVGNPTGGPQGAGSVNIAGGLFINGVAVGGGSTPGGVVNSVQYNDGAGGFAGESNFIYDPTNDFLLVDKVGSIGAFEASLEFFTAGTARINFSSGTDLSSNSTTIFDASERRFTGLVVEASTHRSFLNSDIAIVGQGTGIIQLQDETNLNNNKIVDLADPTNAQDAATKQYVDDQVTNLTGGQIVRTPTATTNYTNPGGTYEMSYIRSNNIVSFSWGIQSAATITTGSGDASFALALPVASDFTVIGDVVGVCTATGGNDCVIQADITNDRILVTIPAPTSTSSFVQVSGHYVVQ